MQFNAYIYIFISFENRLILKYRICYSNIRYNSNRTTNSQHPSVISNVTLRSWRHVRVMVSSIWTQNCVYLYSGNAKQM